MPLKSILLVVFAVALAALSAILVRSVLSDDPAPQPAPVQSVASDTARLLVAARDLPLGRILTAEDMSWQSWPEDGVNDSYIVEGEQTVESLAGHVLRAPLPAGLPFSESGVIAPGQRGFLAAALKPGWRAITVAVDPISGVSGFVFPGDRVDILLNHRITRDGNAARNVSETVLANVRVLAVDRRTMGPTGGDEAGTPQPGKTMTLEVTPKMAQRIALLREMGSITLALRSLPDDGDLDNPDVPPALAAVAPTWDSEVSPLLPAPDREQDLMRVRLSRGGEVSTVEFPRINENENNGGSGS